MQRFESVRDKKYTVEIQGTKVESFKENEDLLKHGAKVIIRKNIDNSQNFEEALAAEINDVQAKKKQQ